jgi:hypothetical protein
MVTGAVLFLLAVFWTKKGLPWSNKAAENTEGLAYESALVEDLLKRDVDQDGVLDWEESLMGLDPTKPETTPGIPDITVAAKLRADEGWGASEGEGPEGVAAENLTETDKFSRELFSTVAALEQGGSLDQATAEKMINSLVNNIENSTPRKVYIFADLNINNGTSAETYNTALNEIYNKYPVQGNVMEILQRFASDPNNVDPGALEELTQITAQNKKIVEALVKTKVPQDLSALHLNVVNALEAVTENLSDIQLYDQDAIVALGGMTRYQENALKLEANLNNLAIAVSRKLSN